MPRAVPGSAAGEIRTLDLLNSSRIPYQHQSSVDLGMVHHTRASVIKQYKLIVDNRVNSYALWTADNNTLARNI